MFDFHMHSRVSFDGHDTGRAMAQAALDAGLKEICFTDHVDYGIKRDLDDPRGIACRGGDGVNSSLDDFEPLTNVDYPKYFAI